MKVQDIPVADSPNNDAFEAIVELYYQVEGYITSAGKWFWIFDGNKQQRGYQDIDVLAVGAEEIVIVSVTSNLDDKVNTQAGSVNVEKLEKLVQNFNRVKLYLETVPQYKWLTAKQIKWVVAYNHGDKSKHLPKLAEALKNNNIDLLHSSEIFGKLSSYARGDNLKIQNQMLRVFQLLNSELNHISKLERSNEYHAAIE